MTTARRDGIVNPAEGLMLYNTTTHCLEINFGSGDRPVWTVIQCRGGTSGGGSASSGRLGDNLPPDRASQSVTVQLDAAGQGALTTAPVDHGTTDSGGIAGLVLGETSFGCAEFGNDTVTMVAMNNCGNSDSCQVTLTMQDLVAPVATCQNVTVSLNAAGTGGTTAAAVDNGSTDACGIASLSLSQTSFDCTQIGENTHSLTVTDNNGNTATSQATVTVQDLVVLTVPTGVLAVGRTLLVEDGRTVTMEPTATMAIIPY